MVTVWPQTCSGLSYADEYDKPVLTLPTPSECMPSILARPDQWLGRGRRCVTRVLKPSVLVDLHVKGPAVLMAGPVRCASKRMSVSRHTSPLEPASGLDAPACAVMASPGHPRRGRGRLP